LGRFRVKWGDREIEYEGTDSDAKYLEALELVKAPTEPSSQKHDTQHKPEADKTHTGGRKPLFAPEIVKLIDEHYFRLPNKRTVKDVIKTLQDRGLPVSGKYAQTQTALKRLLKDRLKGTKTEEGWIFWES
jgi:hypothetical protein